MELKKKKKDIAKRMKMIPRMVNPKNMGEGRAAWNRAEYDFYNHTKKHEPFGSNNK